MLPFRSTLTKHYLFFYYSGKLRFRKFWPYLGAQWLKLNSEMEKNKYMQRRQAVRRKNIRKIWSLDTQKEFYLQFWENLLCIVNVGVHRFMWFLIRSLWNPVQQELKTLCTSLYLLGSLTKNDRDGFENVNWKVKSRCFKVFRAYSILFNSSNVGNFSGVEL